MYKVNFKEHQSHIHFIGIGGISMSGLARILLMQGFTISGSDLSETPLCEELKALGATIFYGQVASNIIPGIDCVVYTAAISQDNEEYLEAKRQGLHMLGRSALLGQIMDNYKMPIAVAGTHGKTTTTSMVSTLLLAGGLDPTISVGGILPAIGGNLRIGQSDIFVTEDCEYTNSFLDFRPKVSIILNIEEDHMDFFKGIEEIYDSFHRFARELPPDGHLIINGDIPDYEKVTYDLPCQVTTYGFQTDLDYSAQAIAYDEKGLASFDFYKKGVFQTRIQLSVTGEHNVSNALSVIALGEILALDLSQIQTGLVNFDGTKRRFEYKGSYQGVHVIDDYAHHPTEIKATLQAAKHYQSQALWLVFQPHTFTRTKAFFKDFVEALSPVDHLILTDIYAAREKNTLGISSEDLYKEILKTGCDAYYIADFENVRDFLQKNCASGDLLITMGAGDVVNIGENLLNS